MREITLTVTVIFCLACTLSAQLFDPVNVLTDAEQMPYFPGCEDFENNSVEKRQCSNQHLIGFVSSHLIYPESAQNRSVEGTVFVSFIISEKGKVIQPSVLKDIGEGCGEAALEVIRQMPMWEAAVHEGENVPVKLNLPVQFSLKSDVGDLAENYNISWGTLTAGDVTAETLKENLINTILVRDPLGETFTVNELVFVFEKKKRIVNARNTKGRISKDLVKVIDKTKKGGTFTISASIQDDGELIWVSRSFQIVD